MTKGMPFYSWSVPFLSLSIARYGFVSSQRYIISFDVHEYHAVNQVVVYDLLRKTQTVSAVKCPEPGLYHGIAVVDTMDPHQDALLAQGFVRRMFKVTALRETPLLPLDVVKLIGKWIGNEYESVHLQRTNQISQRNWTDKMKKCWSHRLGQSKREWRKSDDELREMGEWRWKIKVSDILRSTHKL